MPFEISIFQTAFLMNKKEFDMQTASQMLAAKKQAKADRKKEKAVKASMGKLRVDRNRLANISFSQHRRCVELRDGEPIDEEAQLDYAIMLHLHYEALTYDRDSESLIVFEQALRYLRCVGMMFSDTTLLTFTNASQKVLKKIHNYECEDLSPNQKRKLLQPILSMINRAKEYSKIVPKETQDLINSYCYAVQASVYLTRYLEEPNWKRDALSRIILGEKISDVAETYLMKHSDLRITILNTAWFLYRIAEAFAYEHRLKIVTKPTLVTDLKKSVWKPFANTEWIRFEVGQINQRCLYPFQTQTGIKLI